MISKKLRPSYIFKKISKLNKNEKIFIFYLLFLLIYSLLVPIIHIYNFESQQIEKSIKLYQIPLVNFVFFAILVFLILYNYSNTIKKIFKTFVNSFLSQDIINFFLLTILFVIGLTITSFLKTINLYATQTIKSTIYLKFLLFFITIGFLILITKNKKRATKITFINLDSSVQHQQDIEKENKLF